MQTSNFKLITIKEIKTLYSFLIDHEGFDYFDEWEDQDLFLVSNEDMTFEGNFYLDLYEDKEKKPRPGGRGFFFSGGGQEGKKTVQ